MSDWTTTAPTAPGNYRVRLIPQGLAPQWEAFVNVFKDDAGDLVSNLPQAFGNQGLTKIEGHPAGCEWQGPIDSA